MKTKKTMRKTPIKPFLCEMLGLSSNQVGKLFSPQSCTRASEVISRNRISCCRAARGRRAKNDDAYAGRCAWISQSRARSAVPSEPPTSLNAWTAFAFWPAARYAMAR